MYSTHSAFAHALSRAQLKQSDGDEVRNGVYISDEEEHELHGSKARAQRVRRACAAAAAEATTRLSGSSARVPAGGPPALTRALRSRCGRACGAQGTAHFVFSWPEIKKQARARTPRERTTVASGACVPRPS